MGTRWLTVALSGALWTLALPCQAEDVAAAANAFGQGQRAELAGQYGRAAEFYELADSIAPTPEALRAAIKAHRAAGDLGSAASAAERLLERYPQDARSRELANDVLSTARSELTRVSIHCEAPCSVVVDGYATATKAAQRHVLYLNAGEHQAQASFETGATEARTLEAMAGQELTVRWTLADARPPEPAPASVLAGTVAAEEPSSTAETTGESRRPAKKGLSPVGFYASLGATAVLGAVAIWSAVDTKNAADAFRNDPTPTRTEFDDGESKDLRTNVLFAASMVGVATTAVLGYFTFGRRRRDTQSAEATRVHVTASRGGAGMIVAGAF